MVGIPQIQMRQKQSEMDISAFNYFIWDSLYNISIYQSIKIVYLDLSVNFRTRCYKHSRAQSSSLLRCQETEGSGVENVLQEVTVACAVNTL